jgi:HSP20 family protein
MIMAITRWDSMQETFPLREAMNRMLEATHVRPEALFGPTGPVQVDVYAEGDTYVVEVAVPGLSPDALNVDVLGSQVTVSGEYPATPQGRQYLLREHAGGRFQRTLTLPAEIDAAKVEGHCENGLLRLTAPKAEHARPKRLALTAGK